MDSEPIENIRNCLLSVERLFLAVAANERFLDQREYREHYESRSLDLNALERLPDVYGAFAAALGKEDQQALHGFQEFLDAELVMNICAAGLELRKRLGRWPIQEKKQSTIFSDFLFWRRPTKASLSFGLNRDGEPRSLESVVLSLQKFRIGVAGSLQRRYETEIEESEIFKPSSVEAAQVVKLIDQSILEVRQTSSLSSTEVFRLVQYLEAARREACQPKPKWSRIIAALVIVAAVTSGLADAPNATKTVRETLDYIMGLSIVRAGTGANPQLNVTPAQSSPQ